MTYDIKYRELLQKAENILMRAYRDDKGSWPVYNQYKTELSELMLKPIHYEAYINRLCDALEV